MLEGRAEASSQRLAVEVRLRNLGAQPVHDLELVAELDGHTVRSSLAGPILGDAEASAHFELPSRLSRPGLHAMIVRIAYSSDADPDPGARQHQLAYLGFPFAANPEPAFEIELAANRIGWSGALDVRLRSLEGVPHRVALRALTAPGLSAWPAIREIDLPAGGVRHVALRLLRSGAQPGSRHGVLVEARLLDGPLERARVETVEVELEATRGRLPAWRKPLLALALLLLGGAAGLELRHRRAAGNGSKSGLAR